MKTALGYLQGYNAQAIVGPGQIVLAAELTNCASDVGELAPVLAAAKLNLRAADVQRPIGTLLADAGYLSDENLTGDPDGPDRLIATMKSRRLAEHAATPRGRIPAGLSPTARMTRRLLTKRGQALYRRRSVLVEPVFGQVKGARQITCFMRRGREACDSEWKLITLTHNLLKIWRSGRGPRALARPAAA